MEILKFKIQQIKCFIIGRITGSTIWITNRIVEWHGNEVIKLEKIYTKIFNQGSYEE